MGKGSQYPYAALMGLQVVLIQSGLLTGEKLVDRFVLGILFIANREILALELDVRSTAQALSTREKKIKKLATELLVLKTKMTCPRKTNSLKQNKQNKKQHQMLIHLRIDVPVVEFIYVVRRVHPHARWQLP